MNYKCECEREREYKYEYLDVKHKYDEQASEIILRPAPANILCAKMMDEIVLCLKRMESNPSKKLIIFSGEGKNFSFGASVEEHLPQNVESMLPKFHSFIRKILACPIPTLARVSGRCLGGAFELALACNFIYAEKSSKFAVPEIQLGVFPPAACILLPWKGGDALSSQMIISGDTFDSTWLYERGLINAIAEDGQLDSLVWSWVEKSILPKSASSLRITCKASRMSLLGQYDRFINQLEELYLKDLMSTKDAVIGIKSFTEKKPPKWENA